jgi:hypothetical protein
METKSPAVNPMSPRLDARRLSLFFSSAHDRLWESAFTSSPSVSRNSGFGFNPWTIAGLRRNEVRTCGVLAELWNPAKRGNAARPFLKEFVGAIGGPRPLLTPDEILKHYIVRTEHGLFGDRTTRMDITIEGNDFVMVIEAKIDAFEGKGSEKNPPQFKKIIERLEAYANERGKRSLFVLISRLPPEAEFVGHHTDWHNIARAARRCLPRDRALFSFHDRLLADFANHVANF